MASSPNSTLREARAQYFRENGIQEDDGYTGNWVRIKLGPVPVVFPNTSGRRAALLPHDLHHVATGYDTTLVGEAEIGAWELASGCRHYVAAWVLNLGAVIIGLFLAPRRVCRAFSRGRRSTNLYHLGVDARWPEETVGELRQRLGLHTPSDPRVVDLARAGKLRVALFLPQWTKDLATGEVRGHGTGTVTVQIARALAARLGVEVQLIGYPTPPAVAESLRAGRCDVAFMGITPARAADIRLSPPLIVVPFTLLVPADSSIASVSDADRAGIRIAVVRNHESTEALSRILKHAELVGAEIPDAAFELLRSRQADALASHVLALEEYSTKLPGSRMLEDRYGANLLAMAVSGEQAGWLAYINEFVEEAKASGLVQRAIEQAGVRGIRVAPRTHHATISAEHKSPEL